MLTYSCVKLIFSNTHKHTCLYKRLQDTRLEDLEIDEMTLN
jgi:hypothetical protein